MLRLLTLGSFELASDDSPKGEVVSTQTKRLALLAYLAVATPRGFHRRDTLLGLFWPKLGHDEARRALRQALYHLRQVLNADAITTRADDQVGLLDGTVWCDVVELERALDAKDDALLSDAIGLYRGDFLAGLFMPDVSPDLEEWIERTRSRLRSRTGQAVWRLAESALSTSEAVALGRRAHELSPDDEVGLRRLLALCLKRQARQEGLDAFSAFAHRRTLDDGDAPEPETLQLLERIRSTSAVASADGTSAMRIAAAAPESRTREAPPPSVAPPPEPSPAPAGSSPVAATGRPTWFWPTVAGGALIVAAIVALALGMPGSTSGRIGTGTLAPRDRILVADLGNRSPDSTLAGTITEALRVDLGQSPFIRVMTNVQVRDVLRAMERPAAVSLDDSLARVVALREGVKAFVTGEVSRLGSAFVLSARVVAALSGEELVAVRETARDSSDLIDAIDRLSRQLRGRIGETLRAVRGDPPLAQVMTPSLEALRLYSRAVNAKDVSDDRATAVRLLEKALELDTAFASAERMLGAIYASMAESGRAQRALESAFAHRERLPLRDRYLAMGSYYRNVTADYPSAADAYRSLLELYPDDFAGLTDYALVFLTERQFAAAESLYHRAVAVDSTHPAAFLGIAETQTLQGHHDAARLTMDDVWRRFPEYAGNELAESYLSAAQQDWVSAEKHSRRRLEQSRGKPGAESDVLSTLGQIELIAGRLSDAERDISASMSLSAREQSPGNYLEHAIVLGWLDLRYRGRPSQAIARVDAALARFPVASMAAADRPYGNLALFLVAAGEGKRVKALLLAVQRDSAAVRQMAPGELHALRGAAALADGRGRDAAMEFTQQDRDASCLLCALPALAHASELEGDVDSAIATYERYLNTPWDERILSDAAHLFWSRRRLGELFEQQHQPDKAADEYAKVLRVWSKADVELAPQIAELRARYVRLKPGSTPP